jgi:hypothetical protein
MKTLEEWDRDVAPHLNHIAMGAEMASRHARHLLRRPEWRTHSQDELDDARKVLEAALKEIVAAQATYDAKPLVEV